MVSPNVDPALVGSDVIDPVRGYLPLLGVGKIMIVDLFRCLLGPPLDACVLHATDSFLLLRVHGDSGLASTLEFLHLLADVLELLIAVGVLGAFPDLSIRLQAVRLILKKLRHSACRHAMTLACQFLSELLRALRCPSQRRFRIASCRGIHELVERGKQSRIFRHCCLSASPSRPKRWAFRPGAPSLRAYKRRLRSSNKPEIARYFLLTVRSFMPNHRRERANCSSYFCAVAYSESQRSVDGGRLSYLRSRGRLIPFPSPQPSPAGRGSQSVRRLSGPLKEKGVCEAGGAFDFVRVARTRAAWQAASGDRR